MTLSRFSPTPLGSVSPGDSRSPCPQLSASSRFCPQPLHSTQSAPPGTSSFLPTVLWLPSRCVLLPFFIPTGIPRSPSPKPSSLLSPHVVLFSPPVSASSGAFAVCTYQCCGARNHHGSLTCFPSGHIQGSHDVGPVSFSALLFSPPVLLPSGMPLHSLAWVLHDSLRSWLSSLDPLWWA